MRVWLATTLAALGAALAIPVLAWLEPVARAAVVHSTPLFTRASGYVGRALRPLRLAGEEGLAPTDRERLRLRVLAAAAGFALGLYAGGVTGGLLVSAGAAWLGSRALVWRRERFRRAVDAGAADAAIALADVLAAGNSVRGALAAAAADLSGATGIELRRAVRELDLGATTESALDGLRARCRSRRIDRICAAIRIQRRSGGALAGLLRGIAVTIESQDRLLDEARVASAQARFTSWIVLALPLLGLVLGEAVAPGLVGTVADSQVGKWLLACALALQLCGAWLVLRLAQVER